MIYSNLFKTLLDHDIHPFISVLQVGLDVESESSMTYKTLLTKLPGGMKVVEESYAAIQSIIKELEDYIMVSRLTRL